MKIRTAVIVVAYVAVAGCRPDPRRADGGGLAPLQPIVGAGASGESAPAAPFSDDFDSGTLDPAVWNATSDAWTVQDGAVAVRDGRNHPLWLRRALPCDVRIEFTAWSESPDGDIKVEVMGDGTSFDPDQGSYMSTGYVFIFGGWRNSLSTIARMDEHEARMKTVGDWTRVEPDRRYRWTIEFRGGRIEWSIDGRLFIAVDDPEPLCGPGHDRFAFNNWSARLGFDDLSIGPPGGSAGTDREAAAQAVRDAASSSGALLSRAPSPQHPVAVGTFGGAVRYLGYDLDAERDGHVAAGSLMTFTHYWQVLAPIPDDRNVFVHLEALVDGRAARARGDHAPADGTFPTSAWRAGDFVADRHQMNAPGEALNASGVTSYQLFVGLFRDADRLPVTEGDGADGRLRAGTVMISTAPLPASPPDDGSS